MHALVICLKQNFEVVRFNLDILLSQLGHHQEDTYFYNYKFNLWFSFVLVTFIFNADFPLMVPL